MKIRIITILVLVMAMVLGASTVALAEDTTPTPTATSAPVVVSEIEGNITAIDAVAKTITVTPDSGAAIVLNVTDATDIEMPWKDDASFTDFTIGQIVEVKYETDTKNALKIEVEKAKPGKVQGEITNLDNTANTVTITPKQGEPITLTVSSDTKLKIWGRDPATFTDLQVGDWVKAWYNLTTKEAISIVKTEGEPFLASRTGLFGTVKSKTDTTLVITTKQGDVALALNADTMYWNPPQKNATLADVEIGARVAVLAEKQDAGLLAKRVLIIPAKPVHIQVTGVVSKIEGNTITLTDEDGNTSDITLPAGQVAKIKVGDMLTLTLLKTPGTEKYIGSGMMRDEELRHRLNRFAEKAKGRGTATQQEVENRLRNLERLEGLFQKNREHQQQIFQKILEKAPEQSREALERARENSRRGWEQAQEAIEKARNSRESTPTATV